MLLAWTWLAASAPQPTMAQPAERYPRQIHQLLKQHCVKCHGLARQEAELQLQTPLRIWRGSEQGKVIQPGSAEQSLLWQRVEADQMPPDSPLSDDDKQALRSWIDAGAAGLPTTHEQAHNSVQDEHWAFAKLPAQTLPAVQQTQRCRSPIDYWIESELEHIGLSLSQDTDRQRLIRRASFALLGLPPTPDQVQQFLSDERSDAYERLIDRLLASPQLGVRWGRYWLDAAGYADSNGYFNADSDRPLAYRYRDYVVRSTNDDKPFDQFVLEQLAGDELVRYSADRHRRSATEKMIDQLVATHYLRNGQDGSGESDGNPDEVRIDRYTALESNQQIVASSLLGLTIQCAKCHDHKFEPLSQRDFYNFQAILFPAYNPDHWIKPNDRVIHASTAQEYTSWQAAIETAEHNARALEQQFQQWRGEQRRSERILFEDPFHNSSLLSAQWGATIPGDDSVAGTEAISILVDEHLDSIKPTRPAARVIDGQLQILEGGMAGDKWLSTKQTFDWTPPAPGHWIEVTFDLIANQVAASDPQAERIAFGLALHDFNGNSPVQGGNLLIDGNPAGGAAVHLDYPGKQTQNVGQIGAIGYAPGHNYGVRLTRIDDQQIRLDHLVDGFPEGRSIHLKPEDLPDGSFGFGYCCQRSYIVDNVVIEASSSMENDSQEQDARYAVEFEQMQKAVTTARRNLAAHKQAEPGKIAWLSDATAQPPEVFLLTRGNYNQPGEQAIPAPLTMLAEVENPFSIESPGEMPSSGRRLAWARWVTRSGSRASHLMARVQVNRLWQHYFGTGLVSSSDNLGMSGSEPSNPGLLDWLAAELIRQHWNFKPLHRMILVSTVFRQSGQGHEQGLAIDPTNQLLWRYPMRRLDAEAIRDAQLSIAGGIDLSMGGPYVPTRRTGTAEVVVPEDQLGAGRRSIYLQQRRTQTLSGLSVFDAPSIVTNCTRRPMTTMPLQSLALLNSDFAVARGRQLAERCLREAGMQAADQVELAYGLVFGRVCDTQEKTEAVEFLALQRELYRDQSEADVRSLADFCQLLLASNSFLYVD